MARNLFRIRQELRAIAGRRAGAQLSQMPGKSPEIGLKSAGAMFIMTRLAPRWSKFDEKD
jgi:hypothetical protein